MANGRTETAEKRHALRLGALLEFVDPAHAEQVGARLGMPVLAGAAGPPAGDTEAGRREAVSALVAMSSYQSDGALPVGVLGWMLERDDPEINAAIIGDYRLPEGVRRDIMHGVPFGVALPLPGAGPLPALPVTARMWGLSMDYPSFKPVTSDGQVAADAEDVREIVRSGGNRSRSAAMAAFLTGAGSAPIPAARPDSAAPADAPTADLPEPGRPEAPDPDPDPTGLIAALRQAGVAQRIAPARWLARQVCRADWTRIAAADREQPLGGYARWALSVRPDCPDRLREQFGSWHPRFVKRMHRAGIHRDLTRYLTEDTTARVALEILAFGRWAFAERIAEVYDLVGVQVREELGGNVEAWAVFAQLLPDFTGTLPELLTTAGAIAYGG